MSYNRVCLAGLDTMVLHLHNKTHSLPSTPSEEGPDMSSYLEITCGSVEIKGVRKAGRPPLSDRTPSLNTTVFSTISSNFYDPQPEKPEILSKPVTSTRATHPNQLSIPAHKSLPDVPVSAVSSIVEDTPITVQDIVSKPLPSLPSSTSSLEHPESPAHDEISVQHDSAYHEQVLEILPPVPSKSQEIHNEPYEIPTPEHPNSPYVPWPSLVRGRIVRRPSHASVASFSHSPATIHSHSSAARRDGARAPEPPELDDNYSVIGAPSCMDGIKGKGKVQALKLKRSFKNLKRAVEKKVPIISKLSTKLHCHHAPVPALPPLPSPLGTPVVLDIRAFTPPLSASEVSVAPYPSSAGSASLAEWLSERRRESMERDMQRGQQDGEGQWGMTLEEYERNGSWLDIAVDEEDEEYDDDVIIDGLTEDINSPLDFTEESYSDDAESEESTHTARVSSVNERQLSATPTRGARAFSSSPMMRRCQSLPSLHVHSFETNPSNETVVPDTSLTFSRPPYFDSTFASSDSMLVLESPHSKETGKTAVYPPAGHALRRFIAV
ncbi:hypothetical protein NEOLEDRAFT_1244405 [Neolentinus lepideus HHB14362 ss-1]|uniref:Uncharacterized protein n=1 Tax=Neolentinus lepideus HHB14362 ss-1 TaxID=1314782 RepID=A0A165PY16_9AGAM|nr:hypothetical protein NEOLEDRAFT_1244405 [Neolentinus lepideus HHB14362 ss-1]